MCYNRLNADEAPACVQACPSGAITIRTVSKLELYDLASNARMLPGAFDSTYTKPSTTYHSSRPLPQNTYQADLSSLRLEHAHWPLIWMLIFTQLACGIFLATAILAFCDNSFFTSVQAPLAVIPFLILNAGLATSVFHLGRPLGAWRSLLGLRTSWMSREILAFSLFAAAGAGFTAITLWPKVIPYLDRIHFEEKYISGATILINGLQTLRFTAMTTPMATLTALLGLLGVFCSAMVYIDTRRPDWSRLLTFTRFFGSTLLLGFTASTCILAWTQGNVPWPIVRTFAIVALGFRIALFGWELNEFCRSLLKNRNNGPHHVIPTSALVIWKLLRPLVKAEFILFLISIGFGIWIIKGNDQFSQLCSLCFFISTVTSQMIGRYFFFAAVVAPRMPGLPVSNP